MLSIDWVNIEKLYQTLMAKFPPEKSLLINMTTPKNKNIESTIELNKLRSFLWKLFDNLEFIMTLIIIDQDNKAPLYIYDISPATESRKPSGDSPLIKGWNKLAKAKKEVQLKLLFSQIMASK